MDRHRSPARHKKAAVGDTAAVLVWYTILHTGSGPGVLWRPTGAAPLIRAADHLPPTGRVR
jgi:hypothetical protein